MTLEETLAYNPLRKFIGDILSTTIIKNRFFEMDLWSFVHLLVGALIMFIFIKWNINKKKRYLWLVFLLIGFEIIEYFLYTNYTILFIPETKKNVFWDIIIGLGGSIIIDSLVLKPKHLNNIKTYSNKEKRSKICITT